jgi:hypothetical protein
MPILNWLLRANGVQCAIQSEWAALRRLSRPPRGLLARVTKAFDLYPCELLFVHRDAEGESHSFRRIEIELAVAEAFRELHPPVSVSVIPVRMREAWLLFDEGAIRKAAGNPSGRDVLQLPPLERCEDLPDRKGLLERLLREASGLSVRRRAKLRVGARMSRITDYARDFTPLRALPAFRELERDLQAAIAANAWDRR